MKHLFIINPVCGKIKGNLNAVVKEVNEFMQSNPQLVFDMHVSRWSRDILGFCRRYALEAGEEPVRIHVLGGNGTHFEAVNAIVNLKNTELALYPFGKKNMFLHYYGLDQASLFASVKLQVFSETIPIDVIRCNHNYGISNVLIGYEAFVDNRGDDLIKKTHLPSDICFLSVAVKNGFSKEFVRNYKINIDGKSYDGTHYTIMAANQPWYGQNLCPGIDAHPDDGILEFYISQVPKPWVRLPHSYGYLKGRHQKYSTTQHYSGQKMEISSDKLMWLSVDGETFFGNHITCELMPGAISFVLPEGARRQGGVSHA